MATYKCHIKESDQGHSWPKVDYVPLLCRLIVHWGDYRLLCPPPRKSKKTPWRLATRINIISYCGNPSKSDSVPETCTQINYCEQKGLIGRYPVNKNIMCLRRDQMNPLVVPQIFTTVLTFSPVTCNGHLLFQANGGGQTFNHLHYLCLQAKCSLTVFS